MGYLVISKLIKTFCFELLAYPIGRLESNPAELCLRLRAFIFSEASIKH